MKKSVVKISVKAQTFILRNNVLAFVLILLVGFNGWTQAPGCPGVDAGNSTTINCSTADQAAAILSWLNNNGGAEASDVCGNVSWSHDYTDNLSDDCGARVGP